MAGELAGSCPIARGPGLLAAPPIFIPQAGFHGSPNERREPYERYGPPGLLQDRRHLGAAVCRGRLRQDAKRADWATAGKTDSLRRPAGRDRSRGGARTSPPCVASARRGAASWPRARDGRVIKLEANPDHPVNAGPVYTRAAALQGLYHPDRTGGPLKGGKPSHGTRRRSCSPTSSVRWSRDGRGTDCRS